MWWKYAKAGDKVVCIDPSGESGTIEGKVYTIIDVHWSDTWSWRGCQVFLKLGMTDKNGQPWWNCAACFKPVEPKSTETGMNILRKLLVRDSERA